MSSETLTDPIPLLRGQLRRLLPLRVISDKTLRGPFDQRGFIEATSSRRAHALRRGTLAATTVALWQLERLGFAHLRDQPLGNTLNDDDIPREVLPICHVGLGAAAIEEAEFDGARASRFIEAHAHPRYHPFAVEMLGCLWAVYQREPFRTVFRLVSRSGIKPIRPPGWDTFSASFSPADQRTVAHGVGRALFFRSFTLRGAVNAAIQEPEIPTEPATQGIAFAYTLVNHRDLAQTLEIGEDIEDSTAKRGFRKGLVYSLAFWDWHFPGSLEELTLHSTRALSLVESAAHLVETSRANGALIPFGLDDQPPD